MKKPDNIVFNSSTNEYDACKKEYHTSLTQKNSAVKLSNLELELQPYFKKKLLELKEKYDYSAKEPEWNELIYNSKYNFKPILER